MKNIELVVSRTGTVHVNTRRRTYSEYQTACNGNFGIRGTLTEGPATDVSCNKCIEKLLARNGYPLGA